MTARSSRSPRPSSSRRRTRVQRSRGRTVERRCHPTMRPERECNIKVTAAVQPIEEDMDSLDHSHALPFATVTIFESGATIAHSESSGKKARGAGGSSIVTTKQMWSAMPVGHDAADRIVIRDERCGRRCEATSPWRPASNALVNTDGSSGSFRLWSCTAVSADAGIATMPTMNAPKSRLIRVPFVSMKTTVAPFREQTS